MNDSWKEVPFGDLAAPIRNAIVGGPFGSNLVSNDYVESGVPVIRGQNMAGRWVGGDFVFVSEEKATSLAGNLARTGDLVFTQRGTLGQVAIVPNGDHDRYLVSQSQMKATVDAAQADAKFLYYFFSSGAQQDWIRSNAIQTGVPHTNLGILRKHPVLLPSLPEQRAIAAVLGAIDDKIEQNRRTGRALEELARATFKAWFVDFEPVKAKVTGHTSFPGMPTAAFAALPNHLTDSPHGPVPQGWTVRPLAEAFDINPPRRLSKGQDAPYLDMKNMPTDGHAPEAWERRPHGSGMRFINGDTLVARITPCLENGKTAYVDFLGDGEIAWGSTEYIVLRPKPPLPEVYAYCLARTPEFRDFAIQNMTGTSGRQRVAASALEHYHVAVPDAVTAAAFGDVVLPLFKYIRAGNAESSKLATLRDYLLPRLLSGAVRVASKGTL
ncbi:restriction endonuclease subunit S [Paraburkholderia tropica]|uniref:restriction endonuclease subunit S n=1 Tax=Paraburkholderia tropica TaxID=92647 RepID=UPI002AB61AF0|nr:restriction endonuclease subunit S [Paraburkholderia tropica]